MSTNPAESARTTTLPAATDSKGYPFCHSTTGIDCFYLHRRCPANLDCTDNKVIYTEEQHEDRS